MGRIWNWATLLGALAAAGCMGHAPVVARPPAVAADARCVVWARELSFADAVARHDAAAFAEHVHPDAVFRPSTDQPRRGRAAVAQSWAGIIRGDGVTVEWYPARIAVGTDDVAYSSGPALWIVQGKDGTTYETGSFHSVWKRDADGAWRVLFDDGSEGKPASPTEVAAFRAARRAACPAP